MITVTNIHNINYADYDEVWAIVRSLKNPGKMKHVQELSPSWKLFKAYLNLRDVGNWNMESFRNIYVPVFLKEMQNPSAQRKLEELIELDRHGKRFCPDEALCHRSIVAGILQNNGIRVYGVRGDYSQYGRFLSGMAS